MKITKKEKDKIKKTLEKLFSTYTLSETKGYDASTELGLLRTISKELKLKTYFWS